MASVSEYLQIQYHLMFINLPSLSYKTQTSAHSFPVGAQFFAIDTVVRDWGSKQIWRPALLQLQEELDS